MPFLWVLIGGVFCFLHILLLGVVIAYNPASYTHLAEGLGRTGASLVISSVYAAENAVAAIVLAVLVFPLFIPLTCRKVRFSRVWLLGGLVVVWVYYSGRSLVSAVSGMSGFIVFSHLAQIVVAGGALLGSWFIARCIGERLTGWLRPVCGPGVSV